MANVLAQKIPWTEKPGRLQSMGLQRVGHDLAPLRACACARAHTHTHTHTHSRGAHPERKRMGILTSEEERSEAVESLTYIEQFFWVFLPLDN